MSRFARLMSNARVFLCICVMVLFFYSNRVKFAWTMEQISKKTRTALLKERQEKERTEEKREPQCHKYDSNLTKMSKEKIIECESKEILRRWEGKFLTKGTEEAFSPQREYSIYQSHPMRLERPPKHEGKNDGYQKMLSIHHSYKIVGGIPLQSKIKTSWM